MRKLLLVGFTYLLCVGLALAQEKTVTGKVTDSGDGSPLPGVSVTVKGSTKGTSTDSNGKYSISIADENTVLIFSFIGFKVQEVSAGNRSEINISMDSDTKALQEVVITALGEKREKKALGYSVQEVKGDNLIISKSVDVNTALIGKVAGVQLSGSPSSSFDNANIVIRGVANINPQVSSAYSTPNSNGSSGSTTASSVTSTATGTNGASTATPLYIVDGTPTEQQNIIMDNVESISVLKGAAATALYGSRALYGVVMITTKRGMRKARAPQVQFNLGASFEKVSILPKYQNQYAGGYSSSYASKNTLGEGYLDDEGFYIFNYDPDIHPESWAAFNGQRMLEYGADESWGPKMNGQEYRAYWSWYEGDEFGKTTPLVAQPNNVKNFFKTGVNLNNSVSVSGGGETFEYRITYANQHRTLVLPNAFRDQNQFGFTSAYDVSKKLTLSTDITLTSNYTKGRPTEAYRNDGLNVTQNFNQWFQRQLDMSRLKNYRTPSGSLISWNIGDPNATGDLASIQKPQYWDSPYFVVNENYGTDKVMMLTGNVGFNYQINNIFSVNGYARLKTNNSNGDFRIATGGLNLDKYSLYQQFNNESNYEANLKFKKKFGVFSLDGLVGGNIRQTRWQYLFNTTEGGLSSPNYFDIVASIARPTTARRMSSKDVRSLYGRASIEYKTYLYLEGTLRNDWSSALPTTHNSYLYPSISTSFIVSELLNMTHILPYAKIRTAYAQVGSDIDPYEVKIDLLNGDLYNGNPSVEIGNQYRTGNIKPTLTKSWEIGSEVRLFNKLGIDFTYYMDNIVDQIISVDVSSASGYSSTQVNAGNLQRKGWELSLSGTPFKRGDFSWDVTLNLARNSTTLKELYGDLQKITYATSGDIRVESNIGQKWGNIYGRKWATNESGATVFSSTNGTVSYTTNNYIGNIQPDLTGGLFSNLHYKSFDLSFSLDFQKGGLFYSLTKLYNVGTGLSEFTTGVNDKGVDIRTYPSAGGGVRMDGVYNDAATTVYVPARRYYYTNLQRDSRNFILDASYIKLREIRFGYSLPKTLLSKVGITSANFGIMVNNVWLIASPAKKWGIDPSEVENYWFEGGQLSSTRTTGFNLRLTL